MTSNKRHWQCYSDNSEIHTAMERNCQSIRKYADKLLNLFIAVFYCWWTFCDAESTIAKAKLMQILMRFWYRIYAFKLCLFRGFSNMVSAFGERKYRFDMFVCQPQDLIYTLLNSLSAARNQVKNFENTCFHHQNFNIVLSLLPFPIFSFNSWFPIYIVFIVESHI